MTVFGPPGKHLIRTVGDPCLRARAVPVTDFGPALHDLVARMRAVMADARGVGLAANQIGSNLAVFVYDCPDDTGRAHTGVLVNHAAIKTAGLPTVEPEGCLSVPGEQHPTSRAPRATVTGLDLDGRPVTVTGTGFFARCLQHEVDHLNGRLFTDPR
jgi:peptide deformylase